MAQNAFHLKIQGGISGRIICQQQVEDQTSVKPGMLP